MLVLLALTAPALAAPGQDPGEGIAAVVGGDAISSYDVDSRIRFIIVTAKLSNTPEVIERIRPQIIRSLIDEKLELQEAARNNITISDDDIKRATADIEAQRNMPPGTIDTILKDNNVPRSTFIQQVRAQLAWSKLLMKKVRPQVRVSDEDISLAMRKLALPPSKPPAGGPQELKIAVVTLPVDKPSRDTEVRKLGEKLVKEARSGASFEEISRQFSSGTANAGGKVETFWVSPQQLDPHVAQALAGTGKGTITNPVRTAEGYVIIKVYDTRPMGGASGDQESDATPTGTQVTLKEILLKLKPDAPDKDADLLLQIGEDVAKHPGTCQEKGIAGVKDVEDFNIETDMRTAFLSDLPEALQTIAESLKVGDISAPFASDQGIRLYMLCDKKEGVVKTPDRDEVYRMLMQQKMELAAEKYLRNLRREAFIEVR